MLITIPFDPAGVERLREVAEVDLRPDLPPEDLEATIGDYHALIVSSDTPVRDRVIEYAYQLQVIGVAGASLEHLNVSAARAQGVEVVKVPDRRTVARAEQTLGMMLSLAHRRNAVGLAEKKLGIVGFGGLGQEVARRARAFGMYVLVHQPRLTPELALEADIEQRDLEALLAEADIVGLFLPHSAETKSMIGAQELEQCRPSSLLVSTGSPDAIDHGALVQALERGQLAGASLAVPEGWAWERPPSVARKLEIVTLQGPSRAAAQREISLNLAGHLIEHLETRRPREQLSLRVVPLELVLPHENHDPDRVADLVANLETADTLVNPPVVAERGKQYVVLDGATRLQAFRQLGYPHIVVQVVSPEEGDLVLHTWYHAVSGPSSEELLRQLEGQPDYDLVLSPHERLQGAVDAGQAICSLRTPESGNYLVHASKGNPLRALNALVERYTELGGVDRTLNTDVAELSAEKPDLAALVVFPQLSIEEVIDAALSRQLLPAGITRFVIPGRVLRLCADLDRLRAEEPLARKNAWLDRFLAERLSRRKVRYYQEPVIVLDD